MRISFFLLAGFCMISANFVGCSNETFIEQQVGDIQVTMTAPDFDYSNSRTEIEITDQAGVFTWAAHDTVGVFPNTGRQVDFPMVSGAGCKTASFDGGGWALKPSSKYMAYFPMQGKFYLDKTAIPVHYENQVQQGNASTAHLGDYDYMAAVATAPIQGKVNFDFKHLGSLVELRIPLPAKGELSAVTLSTDDMLFTCRGTVDLTSPSPIIDSQTTSHSFTIDVRGITTTSDKESVKVYFMLAPIDLMGKTINVSIKNNGVDIKGKLDGCNLQAGKAYKFDVVMDEQNPVRDTYHVEQAGTLSQMIGEAHKFDITKLKVTGELNGTDIRFIREMAGGDVYGNVTNGQLMSLDLYDAKIVEGGDYYYVESTYGKGNQYTQEDTIDYMFAGCKALSEIILPKSVTSIGNYAFSGCSGFSRFDIPNTIKEIGMHAFHSCSGLTSIVLPNSVEKVMEAAFYECTSLKSAVISDSVTELDWGIFGYCSNLVNVDLPANLVRISGSVFSYCENLTHIEIPNTVTYIGHFAFTECHKLAGIQIPNRIESIHEYTFYRCRSLKKIDIPESVVEIGRYAFSGCSGLESVTIPNSVTFWDGGIFENCSKLYSIDIPNSISSINYETFKGCKSLHSIVIPSSITYIADKSFEDCPNVEIIRLEKGRNVMFDKMLSQIKSCKVIYLPSTLKQIRSQALPSGNLETIYCFAQEPPVVYVNNPIPENCNIYVPHGSVEKYKLADSWKLHVGRIYEIPVDILE